MLGCSAAGVVLFALAGPLSESLALRVTSGGVLFAAGSVLILAYVLARCDRHGTVSASLAVRFSCSTCCTGRSVPTAQYVDQHKKGYGGTTGVTHETTAAHYTAWTIRATSFMTPHPNPVCGISRLGHPQPLQATGMHAPGPHHQHSPHTAPAPLPPTHPFTHTHRQLPGRRSLATTTMLLGSSSWAVVRWLTGSWLPSLYTFIHNRWLLAYVTVMGLLGAALTYLYGGVENTKLNTLMRVGLQLLGLLLLYAGTWTQPAVFGAAVAAVLLAKAARVVAPLVSRCALDLVKPA